jgi:hypothetical protein
MINTATANNLDDYKYLEYIFSKLSNIEFIPDDPVLYEYLSWSEKVQMACGIQNRETSKKN